MRGDRGGRESGFSLLVVLALALLLSTFAMAAALRMRDLARDGGRDGEAQAAFWAAQGGVEAARAALARDPAWAGGELPVAGGTALVRVAPGPADSPLRALVVRGAVPGGGGGSPGAVARVEVVLRLREGRLPEVIAWR